MPGRGSRYWARSGAARGVVCVGTLAGSWIRGMYEHGAQNDGEVFRRSRRLPSPRYSSEPFDDHAINIGWYEQNEKDRG
jgi:hypothetical protein